MIKLEYTVKNIRYEDTIDIRKYNVIIFTKKAIIKIV
jgi:hypothetical protein